MMFKSLVASLSLLVVAGVSHGLPAVVTAPPQVAAQCPYTPGPIPLLLPNPVDCGSFYMCSWYGTALLQHCPPVLHFNTKLQVCDSPEHANCVQRTTAAPVSSITTAAPGYNITTAVPVSNVTTAVPVSNVTTAVPVSNVTTAVPVSNVTTAVPVSNVTTAVPVSNVTTAVPVSNVTTAVPNVTTAVPSPICSRLQCDHSCSPNVTTAVPVSNVTTLPPVANVTTAAPASNITSVVPVNRAATAGVSHGLPAVVTAPPQVAAQCPYTPGPIPLLLPNPVDCGSFYMCSWYGTALLQHCPPVLHFNAKLQVCDSPEHANCIERTTAAHVSSTTTAAPGYNGTTAVPVSNVTTAVPISNGTTL
ncbi:Peritrophin-1 [Penaeus vannamei]|uniref:Peritrophin-1 n=1 Tax=Penaeus vannamei TaxID=6689 RepID=A0A423SJ19_PENVA|nr:Peritrophin-1 [Penaeus vannamei]